MFQIKFHALLSSDLLGVATQEQEDKHENESHEDETSEDAEDTDEDSVGTALGDIHHQNTWSPRLKIRRPSNNSTIHDDLDEGGVVATIIKEAIHVDSSLSLWISESSLSTKWRAVRTSLNTQGCDALTITNLHLATHVLSADDLRHICSSLLRLVDSSVVSDLDAVLRRQILGG